MNKKFLLLLVGSIVLLLSGCADVAEVQNVVNEDVTLNNGVKYIMLTGEPYGFWSGLWHGLILPFSFIGTLFSNNIAIYAVNNTGGWYDFGFGLPLGGLFFFKVTLIALFGDWCYYIIRSAVLYCIFLLDFMRYYLY